MIVKQRDAQRTTIAALDRRAASSRDAVRSLACASAASRLRADVTTQHAADLIDIQFGQSDEWAVIHDLRLRVGGHALQINHVLIDSSLRFICLDTRFLEFGLDIGAQGRCHTVTRFESRPVASPINKMAKDVRMVRVCLQESGILPRRYHLMQRASVQGFILTNPGLRLNIHPETRKLRDTGAYASSALFSMLWKRDAGSKKLFSARLGAEDLRGVAERLAALHEPVFSPALLEPENLVDDHTRALLVGQY